MAKYQEIESGKSKKKLEEGEEPPQPPKKPVPVPPARPKTKIWLFNNVTVNIGAGLNNSLGEQVVLDVTCYPEWDQSDGSRWLRISWRAFDGGMKATKGFEHSGVAKAVLKSETKTGFLGKYDDAHLEPGEQSEDTRYYFPDFQPKSELSSMEKDKGLRPGEETEESKETRRCQGRSRSPSWRRSLGCHRSRCLRCRRSNPISRNKSRSHCR
jgi:hypothetical protein